MLNTNISTRSPLLASRFLERALLFTILAHGLAMLGMALLLLPGMPGGTEPASRVAYIANNPWLWRLGWFPWQLTALSDVILAIAILRTSWLPRYPAYFIALMTFIAVAIEQPGEFSWITRGVTLAQESLRSGNLNPYLRYEEETFLRVGAWAALMYSIMAVGWSWCFAKAKVWHRGLTGLSIVTWGVLFMVSIAPLLPDEYRLGEKLVAGGNAIGFMLMMLWFLWVTELVLRRARPNDAFGRMAPWVYPSSNLLRRLFNLVANSRVARAFGEYLPPVGFTSDITNVIYVNYLVEADKLQPLVPWGLELQRLGTDGKWALFTHLTYQHGHFGPSLLGKLRRMMPSPIQSNWRIYVRDPQTHCEGIYFVSTAVNNPLPALMARLISEGIPMHLVKHGAVTAQPDGAFQVEIDSGTGSAPDLYAHLYSSPVPNFIPPWSLCFSTFHDLLAYCVPQDRAMSSQPWYRRVTRQEIELGIPLQSCEPLTGEVVSKAAHAIVGDAEPVCFRVPEVIFRFKKEEYDFKPREMAN
jgi:hypothetical protein